MIPKTVKIGGNTEGFICQICHRLTDEEEGRIGRNDFICDNCDEEPNFAENIDNHQQKAINNTSLHSFTINNDKSNEITKEIINIEELNSQILIPRELNIIEFNFFS
jgi:hypothetical protein